MIVLGFDPGVSGAIAAIHDDRILALVDMPVVGKRLTSGKLRHRVSGGGVSDFICQICAQFPRFSVEAWIEQVSPRPGEGTVSSFSFGRSLGILEGVLAGLSIPTSYVTPQQWMRAMRTPRDGSIGRAIELCPAVASQLSRKKDHGRADALLIALYGARDGLLL